MGGPASTEVDHPLVADSARPFLRPELACHLTLADWAAIARCGGEFLKTAPRQSVTRAANERIGRVVCASSHGGLGPGRHHAAHRSTARAAARDVGAALTQRP